MSDRRSYRARWIFPVDSPPVANGTIEIEAGRITALHDRFDPRAIDLGNVALLPGLVNAHTHLEFSGLAEPVQPPQPFTAWIKALVAARRGRVDESSWQAVARGCEESRLSGTTLIGEIATQAWTPDSIPIEATGSRLVVFRELLGLLASRKEEQMQIAREHLDSAAALGAQRVTCALSPHAPYSVHPELYAALVELAGSRGAPLAVHLAETRAELELLQSGTGEFVDMLRGFGVWDPAAIPRGTRPLDYLRPLAALRHALVIHGNYLDEAELAFLAEHPQVSVVYCPRTHSFFGHSPHPWLEMLERGISLAVGTDSRGSNPDLSLWKELQFLRVGHPDVDSAVLLELGTIRGARTLGFDSDSGSLAIGKRADLAIALLPAGPGDPYDLLFAAEVGRFAAPGGC